MINHSALCKKRVQVASRPLVGEANQAATWMCRLIIYSPTRFHFRRRLTAHRTSTQLTIQLTSKSVVASQLEQVSCSYFEQLLRLLPNPASALRHALWFKFSSFEIYKQQRRPHSAPGHPKPFLTSSLPRFRRASAECTQRELSTTLWALLTAGVHSELTAGLLAAFPLFSRLQLSNIRFVFW